MTKPTPPQRLDRITRVLWAILVLNLLVAVAKILYGLRSGALAIGADGLHSVLDAASNGIGLIAIGVARRPPDANHPYGHRKYETFAALAIAALMFIGSSEILTAAIERLREPRVPVIAAGGFTILIGTILVNLVVVWTERRAGKQLQSELLLADAAHTGSDVLASLVVLASFVAARFGITWADVAATAVILVLILRAGIGILKSTLSTLSDERRIDPREVEATALEEPDVIEAHNVRSRGPSDDIHLDLHVLVEPRMAIADAHAVGHRVERRLRDRFAGLTDVVVHVEPGLEGERAKRRVGGGLKARD